jgi:nitroimidazol reductase NimA-like FMN-containing flavoprotein (pyridoxamine 5'-phosphate oxidase superfamily)
MVTIDGRTSLEYLSTPVCWELLASTPVGRIGVLNDSAPEVYPVNHVVDGRSLVFRTDAGTKLRGLLRNPSVCYEVDGFDTDGATGWSVLVKGRATQIKDPAELRAVAGLPLRYWTPGGKAHWVRIVPADVTGRRILAPAPQAGPAAPG